MLAALAGVILWQVSPPREPVYEGKPLSSWLKAYATPGGPEAFADEAVRQAGTNAIPQLLSLLRFEDSALKVKFMDLVRQQHIVTIQFTTAAAWNWAGAKRFERPTHASQSDFTERAAWTSASNSNLQHAVVADGLLNLGPGNRAKTNFHAPKANPTRHLRTARPPVLRSPA